MIRKTPAFNALLLHYEGVNASLLRYCMSDKVSVRLDAVLEGEMDPVTYARRILNAHYKDIYETLFREGLSPYSPPRLWTRSLIFDRLVVSAVLLRTTTLRPHGTHHAKELSASVYLGLFFLDDSDTPEVSLCGLADFSSLVQTLVDYHSERFASGNVPLLQRLGKAISSVHKSDWLFYQPVWKKTFESKLFHYRTLRGFLHIALTSYLMTEASVSAIFDMERHEILVLMEELIDLIESEDTSCDQIEKFLYYVNPYTYEIARPHLLSTILEGDFETAQALHHSLFGDKYEISDIPPLNGNQLCLTFLRSLGLDYAPEMIIETDLTPGRYVNTVLRSHRADLYRGTVFGLTAPKDLAFQINDPQLRLFTDAIIKNTLLPQIVYRRYLHVFDYDVNRALQRVRRTEHLLLIMLMGEEEEPDTVGLSRAASLLRYHVGLQSDLSMDEILPVLALSKVLTDINFSRPSRMTNHWKELLRDNSLCSALRATLFIIIEALHITDVNRYHTHLGMDHRSFFLYLRGLTEVLQSYPSAQEVQSLLLLSPHLTSTTSITLWDQMLWSDSFSIIPEQKTAEIPCVYHNHRGDREDV